MRNLNYNLDEIVLSVVPKVFKEKNKKLLRSNCEFNTLASVKILEELKNIVR